MTLAYPPYFTDPLDQALFTSAPTLIQTPSGAALPPLPAETYRFVLAKQGLFLQTQTAALEVCLPLTTWTPEMPYGWLRPGWRLKAGPWPDALWRECQRRAHAQCPQEWGTYLLLTDQGYQIHETLVLEHSDHHLTYQALDRPARTSLVAHVHSHGYGAAFFSTQDDVADQSGEGVYLAIVLGRCGAQATMTAAWRLVVWGWLIPLDAASLAPVYGSLEPLMPVRCYPPLHPARTDALRAAATLRLDAFGLPMAETAGG